MHISSTLVGLLLPLANAADSTALRGTKLTSGRELQTGYIPNNPTNGDGGGNIDHLGGGDPNSGPDLSDLADIANNVQNGDLTGIINGAIGNGGGGIPGAGDGGLVIPGAGNGLPNIPGIGGAGGNPTIIGGVGGGIGGGGNAVDNINNIVDSVNSVVPGIPDVDLSDIPNLPDDFAPPDLSGMDIANINITELSNNVTNTITDNIPDTVVNNINTISGEVGTVPGDVCESIQNMSPDEAQSLFESLDLPENFTIPDNFTLPTDLTVPDSVTIPVTRPEDIALGQNLTSTYGQNFTSTYGQNFTIVQNLSNVGSNVNDIGANVNIGENVTLPQNVTFNPQNFLLTYVGAGQIPCPVNGTFAPGTTLPPAVSEMLQNIAGNYSLPIIREPERCSTMNMQNVSLLIKVMPDKNDGLECATNFFKSLGPDQSRDSIMGQFNGEFRGSIKFYFGTPREWAAASARFAGITCDMGRACTLDVRGASLTTTRGTVMYKRVCPTGLDYRPCNVITFGNGKTYYVRRIRNGRWVSLVRTADGFKELTGLINKETVNEIVSEATTSATNGASNVASNIGANNPNIGAGPNSVGMNSFGSQP